MLSRIIKKIILKKTTILTDKKTSVVTDRHFPDNARSVLYNIYSGAARDYFSIFAQKNTE